MFVRSVPEGELPVLLATLNLPAPVCFRVNTLKASVDDVQRALVDAGVPTSVSAHARTALLVAPEVRPNVYGLGPFQTGQIEVQDEGSQLLGLLVGAQPGERILDLCAGAGGKTLLLAAQMQNQGALYAFDIDGARLQRLRTRASRAGATCVRVLLPPTLPHELQVDRVLVDAPCSELGALRRGPDARFACSPGDFDHLPALQGQLLDSAVTVLRPGGTLVYATCTLRPEENEEVAWAFEKRHPGFERIRPGAGWLDESFIQDGFFRSFPHRHGTDGFFAAVYRRGIC